MDTITVSPLTTVNTEGGEQLSVAVTSTSALTSMTVQLFDATMGNLVMNVPMTGPGIAGASTWTSGTLTTATLPLGTYNYTVTAADAGGGTLAGTLSGPFAFQETPTITLNVNPVVSYDNQAPVISGTVTTLAPGATTAEPYTGQVVIDDSLLGDTTVTTDASGGYRLTVTDPDPPSEHFTVEVQPTATVAAAATPTITFTAQTDTVAIAAILKPKAVTYGTPVTVSGTVSYKPRAALVPLPGESVRIYDRPGAPRPVMTVVTDKNGRFTATLPGRAATVHWVLQASGPYLTTASLTLPMKVSLPTAVTGFQAALSQFWQLSYRGCLTLPAGIRAYVPGLSGLVIQYATSPNGPWSTLGAVPRQDSVVCGNGGRTFSGRFTARLSYAYYRAWYAGATDAAGTGYLSSASGRVLAWKFEDRITGFRVTPHSVLPGGTLTVAGQLQYFAGRWRDYARQQVYVILRPLGSKTWYFIVIATTNAAGVFSATFADPVSATWSAEFFGNSAHLATLAATAYVPVT